MGNLLDILGLGILAAVAYYIYSKFRESGGYNKETWDNAIKDANTRLKKDREAGTLAAVTRCPSDSNLLAGDRRCGSKDTYYQSPTGWQNPNPFSIGTPVWGYDEKSDSYLPASVPPQKVHTENPYLPTALKEEIELHNYLQGLI